MLLFIFFMKNTSELVLDNNKIQQKLVPVFTVRLLEPGHPEQN